MACEPGECCQDGTCRSPEATVADCGGRCVVDGFPATATVCGREVACPSCTDCLALGCPAAINGDGPAGFGFYCVTAFPTGTCNLPSNCPDGSGCFANTCLPICTGAA